MYEISLRLKSGEHFVLRIIRPIFSLSQNNFDSQKFVRFCAHEFTGEEKIDISGFDIRNVASQFEELVK